MGPAVTSEPNAGKRSEDPRSVRPENIAPYDDPQGPPVFDRRATATALGSVDLAPCRTAGGLQGSGHLRITFANDGSVSATRVDQPPFAGTPSGDCVAGLFARVHIPPFAGLPVTVGKSFTL
jgi:hypothetical protein